jgi:para-aminobenzoate synthetase component 1
MTSLPRPELIPLPYRDDCRAYFDIIHSALPTTVLLQSNAQSGAARDRYDIITAAPLATLSTHTGQCHFSDTHGLFQTFRIDPEQDSLQHLHHLVAASLALQADYTACLEAEIPFCGGLLGYCSYDLAREYHELPNQATADIDIPDMQFSFFAWACIQDHHLSRSWLVIHPACTDTLRGSLLAVREAMLSHVITDSPTGHAATVQTCHYDMAAAEYRAAIQCIQQLILDGDCYQINFAQRISMSTDCAAAALYQQLRQATPSPYCTLLPVIGMPASIISLSPERFVQLRCDGSVLAQPIKGTVRRGVSPEEDIALGMQLQNDSKNRAENVMIVDLLRNDIGQVCDTGSVDVQALCELQTFANVHHLVSSITGQLRGGLNGADLLRACFPGGSITGAPKLRAMQIIETLEPTRRSIYCGAIAYFSCHGSMDSNILIRTLLLTGDEDTTDRQLYCWGGGGIVADSQAESEYQESLTKIMALLDSLQADRQT